VSTATVGRRVLALVTGGANGIGAAVVRALKRPGVDVVIADRDIGATPGHVVDVSDAVAVAEMVREMVFDYGGLGAACNCAGVTGVRASLGDYPERVFSRVMAVNAGGVFNCLRSQLPAIAASGGGAIVNVASGAASLGVPGAGAYVASKHAVAGLTRTAAIEYAAQGVRVNAVAPGFVRTAAVELDEGEARFIAAHPTGRAVDTDEVAAVVAWLMLEAPASLTGAVIPVDGGLTAQVAGLA
jgi:NAD(P)-dependent dehydrogenase (short-subunit alcohol dehydrogenase family)